MKVEIYFSETYNCKVVKKTLSPLGNDIIPDPKNIPDLVELIQNKGIATIFEYGDDYYIKPYIHGKTLLETLFLYRNNKKIFDKIIRNYFDYMINFANLHDPYFCIDFGLPNVVLDTHGFHLIDFDDFMLCNRINVLQTIANDFGKLEHICCKFNIEYTRDNYINMEKLKFKGYDHANHNH